uniref:Uncharacterized protein n=2 Tax=Sus scrofa TaxID=9823 RepID=A0A8W4FLQ8_PIG
MVCSTENQIKDSYFLYSKINGQQAHEKMLNILIIREMQIKTTMRYHLTPVRMAIIISPQITNAGECVEKREPSYTVGGNVNWYNYYGTVWKYLRKLNIDPGVPLLGIYTDKTFLEKDTFTHILTAALFTIAKTWKQPKCPSTDDWIKKTWYIYTMEYYSVIKRTNNAICSNMDGIRDSHTK